MFRSLKIYKPSLLYKNMKILKEKSREYKGKAYFTYRNLLASFLEDYLHLWFSCFVWLMR